MNETVEICSVSLVMKLTAGSNMLEALRALTLSMTSLGSMWKSSEWKVTTHTGGLGKQLLIAENACPLFFTVETTKSGLSSSEPKTSCERLLPRQVESGEDTLQKFASGKWDV